MSLSNTKKIATIILLGVLLVSIFLYFYVYKSHRDINSEIATFSVSVLQLHNDFLDNPEASTKKYADKTIETYGKISTLDLENNAIVLDEKLFLTMNEKIVVNLSIGQVIKVKGRFVGYDDLLEELKMDQSQLID